MQLHVHICVFSIVKMLGLWQSPFCKGRFSLRTIILLPCHTEVSFLALDCHSPVAESNTGAPGEQALWGQEKRWHFCRKPSMGPWVHRPDCVGLGMSCHLMSPELKMGFPCASVLGVCKARFTFRKQLVCRTMPKHGGPVMS